MISRLGHTFSQPPDYDSRPAVFRDLRRASLFFVSAVVLLLSCALVSERYEKSFKTYRQAMILHEYLPDCVPPSATDIKILYNWDVNETWATFCFSKDDMVLVLAGHEAIPSKAVPYPPTAPSLQIRWWPIDLIEPYHERLGRYVFYRGTGTLPEFLAVSHDSTKAWYWHLDHLDGA